MKGPVRLTLLGLCGLPLHGCAVMLGPNELSIGITVGFGLYLLANVFYAKMRLEDEPSAVRRITAFLLGLPTTFLIFLLVEPQDSWIQRRLQHRLDFDPDADLEAIQRDTDRELLRIRQARVRDQEAPPSSDLDASP